MPRLFTPLPLEKPKLKLALYNYTNAQPVSTLQAADSAILRELFRDVTDWTYIDQLYTSIPQAAQRNFIANSQESIDIDGVRLKLIDAWKQMRSTNDLQRLKKAMFDSGLALKIVPGKAAGVVPALPQAGVAAALSGRFPQPVVSANQRITFEEQQQLNERVQRTIDYLNSELKNYEGDVELSPGDYVIDPIVDLLNNKDRIVVYNIMLTRLPEALDASSLNNVVFPVVTANLASRAKLFKGNYNATDAATANRLINRIRVDYEPSLNTGSGLRYKSLRAGSIRAGNNSILL